jgi:RHS repeat-associated protein
MTSTDRTFTGQRDITGTGLMDYNFRMYSPLLGRFTQPDTIIPDAANPQSWNRFSYVINNPIGYNDPTGHCYTDSGTWISGGGDGDCGFATSTPASDGSGGGGGEDKPSWDEIINPNTDPYIAYTINGQNYWASCGMLGGNCSSSITYNLNGRDVLSLLMLLKNYLYPNFSLGQQISKDTGDFLLSKGFPPYEYGEKLYELYEFNNKTTISNAYDTLGHHLLLNNPGGDGPAISPSVNITFTKGLQEIRPMTPFESLMTPGGGGTYHGQYAGVVMTVTNMADPSISTSHYLGEASGYGDGFSTLLEITRMLSE